MLTKGQQKGLDTALDLRDEGKTMMLLEGPGGTGKSYVTHKIAEAMGIPQDRVQWTATTHKACEALEESDPLCAGAITIQSLLKMRVTDTQEVKSLAPVGEVDLEDIDLVIIDEASFLGRGVVNRIFKVAERFPNVFWIMSGDSYQLLVVREGMSTIFNRVRDSVRLTKNMRQKEKSKVRSTTLEVRAEIKEKIALLKAGKRIKVPPLKFEEELHETGSLFTVKGKEFNRMFIKSCLNDPNTVALSWTNRTANSLNNMVRSEVYSDRPLQPYYVGESIWSGAELVDYLEGLVIARSHRRGEVLKVETRDMIPNLAEEWGLHVSGYRLHVVFGGMSGTVYVPDEAGWKIVNERKAIIYKNATNLGNDGYRWSQYHSFVDSVADIRYSWAMTAHASQGSTLGKTVFIDGDDLNKNKNPLEKLTLWNVALSRGVKDVVIKQR